MSGLKRKGPLVVGTLALTGLVAFLTLYRSSPGELSAAHRRVAGRSVITDCKKCHAKEGLTAGCLSCHTEIGKQFSSGHGFHAFLKSQGKTDCGPCHSEHNGDSFPLVNRVSWQGKDEKAFSHPHVAFRLHGRHDAIACEKCHEAPGTKPFALAGFATMPRSHTKLGLTQACSDCHKDPHANGRSPACDRCHTQESFHVTTPLFDHNRYFPLTNGHAHLACLKCHLSQRDEPATAGRTWAPFDHVQGHRCQDCHENPHRTNWGLSCEKCHAATAVPWSVARRFLTPALHAKTGFRIRPMHAKVSCVACHATSGSYQERFPNPAAASYSRRENSCESCHRDPHAGQFVARHPHCIDCHQERGFRPIRFGVQDHVTFPLEGAHRAVACNLCHTEMMKPHVRKFTGLETACAACHDDVHHGQFAQNGITKCDICHTSSTSWRRISFDHNRQSRFHLDEAHAQVQCQACHPTVKVKGGVTMIRFKPLNTECRACHAFDR